MPTCRTSTNLVIDRVGRANVKSFWLAGHSQGGMTSNRVVCTDFFKDKVDGWLSLSGGRIGPAPIAPDFFGPSGPPAAPPGGGSRARPGVAAQPACDISFIFTSGQLEITGLPETSPWAEKYGCGARTRRPDVVDSPSRLCDRRRPGRGASWGRAARPGTAEVFVYPNCQGGSVVADVVRMDKGHTEGLEPNVTETLVALMASAPGGKVRRRAGKGRAGDPLRAHRWTNTATCMPDCDHPYVIVTRDVVDVVVERRDEFLQKQVWRGSAISPPPSVDLADLRVCFRSGSD